MTFSEWKKSFYTRLASTSNAKHSKSQSLQPKQKKPRNRNIGSQTFSNGTPFVGPVLSPTKSHSIISLANQIWHNAAWTKWLLLKLVQS